jgi:hypothetical protein
VLRETTSRGLCGLVCPSRTSERGTRAGTLTQGGALFSLVPLVWEEELLFVFNDVSTEGLGCLRRRSRGGPGGGGGEREPY